MPKRYVRNLGTWFTVGIYLVLGVLAFVSWQVGSSEDSSAARSAIQLFFIIVAVFVVLAILALSVYVVDAIILAFRRRALKRAAKKMQLTRDVSTPVGSALYGIARDKPASTLGFRGSDWTYTELEFSHVNMHLDNRPRKTKTVYFAVAAFRLPRVLPNVFFDSKRTRNKSFRLHFDQSQRHDLEGDFNTHFDTYFVNDYEIDSMSFITPDIMHKLIALKDYDIELYGNALYLIAPLRPMPGQLEDMRQKGMQLRDALYRNITTYHDERIYNKSLARLLVTVDGLQLKKSSWRFWLFLTSALVLAIVGIVAMILSSE